MCLGIPGQIVEITDESRLMAMADVSGVRREVSVACIADGISTGRNSHLAAQLAVTQFPHDYYATPESWTVRDCARRLISALNSFFYAQNRSGSPANEGQVTTFTALIARSTTAYIVHIGDTRCLRLRKGKTSAAYWINQGYLQGRQDGVYGEAAVLLAPKT